jgi:undecaprenyl-diphosphatase
MNLSETLQLIIAGIFQGITELLPVSSSGHLLLLNNIFGGDTAILDIAILHIGTLGSILFVFRDDLKLYFDWNFLIKVIISAMPAGIAGFIMEEVFEINLVSPALIIFTLIFWGIILIITDTIASKRTYDTNAKLTEISLKQALFIGLGQCLALIPGTSRSGITTMAGIAAGLSPTNSLRYSFLVGIPLITASGGFAVLKLISENQMTTSSINLLMGTIVSFIVGLATAYILKKYINKNILTICGIYRIIIGLILLTTFLL